MELTDQDIALVALREYASVGPRTFQILMTHFGEVEKIFDSLPGEIAELPRMSAEREEQIRISMENAPYIRKRLSNLHERGIELTTILHLNYPQSLSEIATPPPLFYWKGDFDALRGNCVAIVGSHAASSAGIVEAVRLGKMISATGAIVVSGLARGIDSGAHLGSLKGDGKTIAVLGCGLEDIYPPENMALADNIAKQGLLLTESPPDPEVSVGRLMARNRLIVGLARSVIVVETTADSGGTAGAITETLRQGKSLFTCFNPNRKGSATNDIGAVQLANEDDWKMVLQYMV
ncbi:MAG: DNA-processing protein DprA [Candidatus Zixiibacteriota bacterium]|nr:MAG: DNA-processing protein DprA [candidate division Zixibacteria bacterium]